MPDTYHVIQENTAERTEETIFTGTYGQCRTTLTEKIKEEKLKHNRVKIYSQEDACAIMLPGTGAVVRYYHIIEENDYAESQNSQVK